SRYRSWSTPQTPDQPRHLRQRRARHLSTSEKFARSTPWIEVLTGRRFRLLLPVDSGDLFAADGSVLRPLCQPRPSEAAPSMMAELHAQSQASYLKTIVFLSLYFLGFVT